MRRKPAEIRAFPYFFTGARRNGSRSTSPVRTCDTVAQSSNLCRPVPRSQPSSPSSFSQQQAFTTPSSPQRRRTTVRRSRRQAVPTVSRRSHLRRSRLLPHPASQPSARRPLRPARLRRLERLDSCRPHLAQPQQDCPLEPARPLVVSNLALLPARSRRRLAGRATPCGQRRRPAARSTDSHPLVAAQRAWARQPLQQHPLGPQPRRHPQQRERPRVRAVQGRPQRVLLEASPRRRFRSVRVQRPRLRQPRAQPRRQPAPRPPTRWPPVKPSAALPSATSAARTHGARSRRRIQASTRLR
jgi:hypothetical protein